MRQNMPAHKCVLHSRQQTNMSLEQTRVDLVQRFVHRICHHRAYLLIADDAIAVHLNIIDWIVNAPRQISKTAGAGKHQGGKQRVSKYLSPQASESRLFALLTPAAY